MELILIWPVRGGEKRLEEALDVVFAGFTVKRVIEESMALRKAALRGELQRKRLLFAMSLGRTGVNLELYSMLEVLRMIPGCLKGSVAGIVVDGEREYDTKATGREVVWTANEAGCWFVGRPLVEGTGSLKNYGVMASNSGRTLYEAYLWSVKDLAERICAFQKPHWKTPRLLCVHSCNPATSNTLQLWRWVEKELSGQVEIQEISLRGSAVPDCAGCSYDTCMEFGRSLSCYCGGSIVEEVYPALEACNGLVLLCPNYNDALGANLTAFVNRLTALFRQKPFSDKCLFALIVSGYSGGDIIAGQLIGGLNMNKSFILPGNFALMETANCPGSIAKVSDIHEKVRNFAENMRFCMGQEGE